MLGNVGILCQFFSGKSSRWPCSRTAAPGLCSLPLADNVLHQAGWLDQPWKEIETGHWGRCWLSGVFDATCGEGDWLTRMVFGVCSSIASPRKAWGEVAMASGMAGSIPFRPSGFPTMVEGRTPKAADGSFLLGMLCWEVVARERGGSFSTVPPELQPRGSYFSGGGGCTCHIA